MMAWLRKNAHDPEVGIDYCVLNHTKENSKGHHCNVKGRPSKKTSSIPISNVNETMTHNDVPGGHFETITFPPKDSLSSNARFVEQRSSLDSNDLPNGEQDNLNTNNLNNNDLNGNTDDLVAIANLTRRVLDDKHIQGLKVMLGAS